MGPVSKHNLLLTESSGCGSVKLNLLMLTLYRKCGQVIGLAIAALVTLSSFALVRGFIVDVLA